MKNMGSVSNLHQTMAVRIKYTLYTNYQSLLDFTNTTVETIVFFIFLQRSNCLKKHIDKNEDNQSLTNKITRDKKPSIQKHNVQKFPSISLNIDC